MQFGMKSLFVAWLALAANVACAEEADIVRKAIAKSFPQVTIDSIADSPVAGIAEVVTSTKEIVYVTKDGKFLLNGDLLDIEKRQNLTRKRVAELSRIKFDALPLDKAIKLVRGNGTYKIAVFTDPLCPYCKQFEGEIDKLKDVSAYIFPLPLPIHPGAEVLAKNAWCSADPAQAWHELLIKGTEAAAAAADCKVPLDEVAALAVKLGVNSTPTLYLESGEQLTGMVPAAHLEKILPLVLKD